MMIRRVTVLAAMVVGLAGFAAPAAAGDEALVLINGNPQLAPADLQAVEAFQNRARAAEAERKRQATLLGYLERVDAAAARTPTATLVTPDVSRFGARLPQYGTSPPAFGGVPYYGFYPSAYASWATPSRAVLRTPSDAQIRAYQRRSGASATEAARSLTRIDVVR